MDQALLTAQAVAIAANVGLVLSILQERFLGKHLEGQAALALNVLLALGCGVAAAFHVGTTITATTHEPIGFAVEVVKVAGAVLVGSQAAFFALTKPVTQTAPAR